MLQKLRTQHHNNNDDDDDDDVVGPDPYQIIVPSFQHKHVTLQILKQQYSTMR